MFVIPRGGFVMSFDSLGMDGDCYWRRKSLNAFLLYFARIQIVSSLSCRLSSVTILLALPETTLIHFPWIFLYNLLNI